MKNRLLAVLPAAVLLCALTLPAFAESVPAPAAKALSAQSAPARENSAPPAALVPDNTARVELPSFDVPCRTAILVAADTGDVLYEKQPDAEVPIASITKVMTLLLTLEAVESGKITLQDIVPVSEHAFSMGGSQIWLEPGEQFTLDELIKAICVCSANDAAVAVAEYVGGTEPVFAEMMNARAAELSMQHSHFVNACGLDAEGHYSSARDVAIMSRALLRHPLILEYSGIWMDSLRGGATQLVNTNKLLNKYPGITGLKTGTTSKAGVCISATATREGMGLIAVVLGADSGAIRFAAATQLLDYGFATYEYAAFPPVSGMTESMRVKHGAQQTLPLISAVPSGVLCRKGEGKNLQAS
ncbi:MAG: D-alanyl-D-alanine carboxypeptidase family protein, partial [Ruthenibacterium sp.]